MPQDYRGKPFRTQLHTYPSTILISIDNELVHLHTCN